MGDFNFEPIFPKYGLKKDPYFREALKIDGGVVPIDTLVGRNKEKEEISIIIQKGGGQRAIVVGEPGVGKTSLVNYMRSKSINSSYFTPIVEIGLERGWGVSEVIVNTLQAIYQEIKRKNVILKNNKLLGSLEELFEISMMISGSEFRNNSYAMVNTQSLMNLYNRTTEAIIECGYRAIIIQYNNLDNIEYIEEVDKLLNNLRDFFQNHHTIFFLIGDVYLPKIINLKSRLREIFTFPEIKVEPLCYEDITSLIAGRLNALKLKTNITVIQPHSEEALKTLYELHHGNIRDILNSLSNSVNTKSITTTSATKTKQILIDKSKELFLNEISPGELETLLEIVESGSITNSELAELTGKYRQHVSSYLKKLKDVKAIEVDYKEGTKIFYKPTMEAMWLKLNVTSEELEEERKRVQKKVELFQKKLRDFSKSI